MTEIWNCLPRLPSKEKRRKDCQAKKSAVKCFFQEHNRMAQVCFKPRPC